MPNPFLAPDLARFRTSINTRWPGRDKSTDGWIGDAAHAARTSDHNPDSTGVVRAIDIDKDGIHVPTVLAAAFLHPSVRYVIHNRRIFHADSKFKPKVYTGSNPHTAHIHVSNQHTKTADNSKVDWDPVAHTFSWPILRQGDKGTYVRQLQAYLNGHGGALSIDGDFGPGTLSAVRAFQQAKKLKVDGVVGSQTSTALRTR